MQWYRIDLHLHTFASIDFQESDVTYLDFLRRAEVRGVDIIACPTCGRTEIDILRIVKKVEKGVERIVAPITLAIMGCVVNGPGEAREADIGIAGGKGSGVLFKKGKIVQKVIEKDFEKVLLSEIYKMAGKI